MKTKYIDCIDKNRGWQSTRLSTLAPAPQQL